MRTAKIRVHKETARHTPPRNGHPFQPRDRLAPTGLRARLPQAVRQQDKGNDSECCSRYRVAGEQPEGEMAYEEPTRAVPNAKPAFAA
jgi:hypothetical protein